MRSIAKKVAVKKVPVRVDAEQWERLDKIRKKFKFKSNYEIMQYILSCFLQSCEINTSCIDVEKFRNERKLIPENRRKRAIKDDMGNVLLFELLK